ISKAVESFLAHGPNSVLKGRIPAELAAWAPTPAHEPAFFVIVYSSNVGWITGCVFDYWEGEIAAVESPSLKFSKWVCEKHWTEVGSKRLDTDGKVIPNKEYLAKARLD